MMFTQTQLEPQFKTKLRLSTILS